MFLQMSDPALRSTQNESAERPGSIRTLRSPVLATCKRLALEPIANEALPQTDEACFGCGSDRDRVPEHPLNVVAHAVELKAVRERLETAKLVRRETPIGPVEGTDGWPWLGLDRPRRSVLGKLEQEAPVTGAPSEEGHARTSVRVEEVVLPFPGLSGATRPICPSS
jgi:hypothetical protein